jgi:hypothetical protein
MLTMSLGLQQPMNGFLRAHKGTPYRRAWELWHKGSGYMALFLAWPTLFMGVALFTKQVGISHNSNKTTISDLLAGILPFLAALFMIITFYCVVQQRRSTDATPLIKEVALTGESSGARRPSAREISAGDYPTGKVTVQVN